MDSRRYIAVHRTVLLFRTYVLKIKYVYMCILCIVYLLEVFIGNRNSPFLIFPWKSHGYGNGHGVVRKQEWEWGSKTHSVLPQTSILRCVCHVVN